MMVESWKVFMKDVGLFRTVALGRLSVCHGYIPAQRNLYRTVDGNILLDSVDLLQGVTVLLNWVYELVGLSLEIVLLLMLLT